MTLLHHLDTWFERYLALCAIATLAFCFAATRYKARQRADITRKAHYPPPVPRPATPPLTQTLPDASWFDGIPADCLSDDAVHSLFDDMTANLRVIEGTEQ